MADPIYLVELNISGATNGWVLGVSPLGTGTILRTGPVIGATLATVTGFLSAQISRGRQDETGQMQAGQLTLLMDNRDGRFSPDNVSSPYYPNMVPNRQIRVSAQYASGRGWTTLFYGYVKSIVPADNGPADANVTITAADWLARAQNATVNLACVQETDTARFVNLTSAIGTDTLPVVQYGSSDPSETVAAKTYADEAGLSALQELAETTRGVVYHARDGSIVYRTRYGKWTAPGAWNSAYIFDQPGLNPAANVMPYQGMEYDLTDQYLYNEVRVTGADAVEQVAQDATSQSRYGRVTLPPLSLPLLAAGRAAPLAATILAAYKDPQARVHAIRVDGSARTAGGASVWDDLFALDLGDTVRVVKRQPGNVLIDRTMFVEGIAHDIAAQDHHTITLQLSDRRQAGPQPWTLGISGSQLGQTTNLVY